MWRRGGQRGEVNLVVGVRLLRLRGGNDVGSDDRIQQERAQTAALVASAAVLFHIHQRLHHTASLNTRPSPNWPQAACLIDIYRDCHGTATETAAVGVRLGARLQEALGVVASCRGRLVLRGLFVYLSKGPGGTAATVLLIPSLQGSSLDSYKMATAPSAHDVPAGSINMVFG